MKAKLIYLLLIVAFIMSGCIGGGGGPSLDTQLSAVMGQYSNNFKNLNAEGMVSLYTCPVTLIDDDGVSMTVPNEQMLREYYDYIFLFYDAVHSFTAVVTSSSRAGSTATAMVVINMDATVSGGYRGTVTVTQEMKFQRVNNQWKIKQEKTISID